MSVSPDLVARLRARIDQLLDDRERERERAERERLVAVAWQRKYLAERERRLQR